MDFRILPRLSVFHSCTVILLLAVIVLLNEAHGYRLQRTYYEEPNLSVAKRQRLAAFLGRQLHPANEGRNQGAAPNLLAGMVGKRQKEEIMAKRYLSGMLGGALTGLDDSRGNGNEVGRHRGYLG